jgi:hypothetical protein
MPLLSTRGAASAQGFGEFAQSVAANYIEDAFSTWLYTGNGATQTITNGINFSTKGGLVWIKDRNISSANALFNTVVGATKYLQSNSTTSQNTDATTLTSFNSNGFSLGSNGNFNTNASPLVSWSFKNQSKFFTCITYTGTGVARNIAHDLGSVPGCIFIKSSSNVGTSWGVYHRSLANTNYLHLDSTNAQATNTNYWNSTTPTSTQFSLGTDANVNANGFTYVAYLFAHNAGGFGLTGTDNVISCGSFTTDGSGSATVNLGYEPQLVLTKCSSTTGDWQICDIMRGMEVTNTGSNKSLYPNLSNAEATGGENPLITSATGFAPLAFQASQTYIYIAIRRGPMKVPTTGTSVYNISSRQATAPGFVSGFPVDMYFYRRTDAVVNTLLGDRLRGNNVLYTNLTDAAAAAVNVKFDYMNGADSNSGAFATLYGWMFRRAPGFMDVCCYTGTGVARTVAHNLAAVPELMIMKSRSAAGQWPVYSATLGNTQFLNLETVDATSTGATVWNSTTPTTSVFSLGTSIRANQSGTTYVAYLFATCPGVSKVGSYTGTNTTQTINCGFTGGARFVLIKRTDSTGDWYVWDSARGIVAGNDPYLLLNSTAAEVTNTDYVDTAATGFEISSTAPAAINASGGTFIFLAIA